MLTKRFSLKALLFSLSLMALTIVANTTQAAFTFQIIAANPTNYQLYGTSNAYSVLAFTDSSSTAFTLSAPTLNVVTSDPDVTFTLNFGGGVKALTSLFPGGTKVANLGTITATVAGHPPTTYLDESSVTFQGTVSGLAGAGNNGTFVSNVLSVTAVPEPGSMALLGVALVGFVWRRRR